MNRKSKKQILIFGKLLLFDVGRFLIGYWIFFQFCQYKKVLRIMFCYG